MLTLLIILIAGFRVLRLVLTIEVVGINRSLKRNPAWGTPTQRRDDG
jgi:hypothetical protein